MCDDLIPTSKVTAIMGISTQRMMEIYSQGRMPEPAVKTLSGWIWRESDIRKFMAGWDRTPGRRWNQGKTGR